MKVKHTRLYKQVERLLKENPDMNYKDVAYKLQMVNKKAAYYVKLVKNVEGSQYVNPSTGQSGNRPCREGISSSKRKHD